MELPYERPNPPLYMPPRFPRGRLSSFHNTLEERKTIDTSTTENFFLIWKDITHILIASERGADLHQELNTALKARRHDELASHDASSAAFHHHQESCPLTALPDELQAAANNEKNCRSISEFDDGDLARSLSSLDETDVDEDNYVDLGISSQIIDEGAKLSQWHTRSSPATVKEIFADDEPLPPWDVHSANDETHLEVDSMSMSKSPPSRASKPFVTDEEVARHQSEPPVERPNGLHNNDNPIPPRPRPSARRGRLRVSDKRDLTPAEVEYVAGLLISKDSMSYFLDNCRAIYEFWMSSKTLACNAETNFVTALDIVQRLWKGNRVQRLLLRFAYMHLAKAIDPYKAMVAIDRKQGNADRDVGIGDATIAYDMYRKANPKIHGEEMKRSTVLGYCRAGRRWAALAGTSPLLVFIFPQRAETIVQNNCITDMTVKAIAYQIQSHYPELTKALINIGQYTGMAPSCMTNSTVPMEDIVLRTTAEMGPIYQKLP